MTLFASGPAVINKKRDRGSDRGTVLLCHLFYSLSAWYAIPFFIPLRVPFFLMAFSAFSAARSSRKISLMDIFLRTPMRFPDGKSEAHAWKNLRKSKKKYGTLRSHKKGDHIPVIHKCYDQTKEPSLLSSNVIIL